VAHRPCGGVNRSTFSFPELPSPIVAILVAVFVLDANFYSTLGPIFVVIVVGVVGMHSPTSPDCTMVPVHVAIHIPHSSRLVLDRLHGVSSEERRTRNLIKIQIANIEPPSGGFFFASDDRCWHFSDMTN